MIKEETFTFLSQLIKNNNREWFQQNKAAYEKALENVIEFAQKLIDQFAKEDPSIPADIDPKKCVMRIYRDVRFSKDKTPYKNNFGIGLSNVGKSMNGAGYYVQIKPEDSFIAGGFWMPQGEHLKAIRQEIDYNGAELKSILNQKTFKSYFGDLEDEEKLKTAPKGYDPGHNDIELLKLKSFTVIHRLKDKQLIDKKSVNEVVNGLTIMKPFVDFLNKAIS